MRKNMNMLNFMRGDIRGYTMSESDAYVWKIVSTWSARKALSMPVAAGRNCHWLSMGIDLKDVQRCVPTINGFRIEILLLFSTSLFSCLWSLENFDTFIFYTLERDLSSNFVLQIDIVNKQFVLRHLKRELL